MQGIGGKSIRKYDLMKMQLLILNNLKFVKFAKVQNKLTCLFVYNIEILKFWKNIKNVTCFF